MQQSLLGRQAFCLIIPWTCGCGFKCVNFKHNFGIVQTRTIRMPAFWGYPHCPILMSDIESPNQMKTKSKVTNLKNLPKFTPSEVENRMCKYEIDLTSIVEDTEWTRICPQMDGRTDGQDETSIHSSQLHWSGVGVYDKYYPGVNAFGPCRS